MSTQYEGFRSGFVSIVGRPNAGKSTLTNAMVGTKVAITSNRPQTTRHAIRGIVHRPNAQIILVDTPGMHRPRTLLGERLNDLVMATSSDVDLVVLCLPADQRVGPGDRFLAQQFADHPVVAVVTKTDLVSKARLAQHLLEVAELGQWKEIVPVSALTNDQIELLVEVLASHLPEGPKFYDDEDLTDRDEEVMIAELVREAALEGVRDELPHSLAAVVNEVVPRSAEPDALVDVRVDLFVERDSQKAIVIGRGGARLREVGTAARKEIEQMLGRKVFLDLHVRVAKDWQSNPKSLRKLGFD